MVPAQSTFTPALVAALEGEGDTNNDGYTTGSELGVHLSQLVPQYVDQTPQYGKIRDYRLSQGDFVFFAGTNASASVTSSGQIEAINVESVLWQSAERGVPI